MAKKQFKAQSKRLLDLMINSIYTNKEIFLREIISNASDALDKLHYFSLTDQKAREQMGELCIKIVADKENRTITVTDSGIGMTKDELEENLGTICKSGSLAFKEELGEDKSNDAANIIGQFGVGFYSAFMVSERLEVRSKSYKDETAYLWESSGADGYSIKECDKAQVGTEIVMYLKADTDEEKYTDYLNEFTLRRLIKEYSDYVRYPIYLFVTKEENGESVSEFEKINSMSPVWKKSKAALKKEESDAFYKEAFRDFEAPIFTIKVAAEGLVSYDALLFVPSKTPYDYFTKEYEKGLKLYSRGVLITEKCSELIPEHYRFVKGVVESDDLSLNISREMLQQDAALKTIAKNLEKKIHTELKKALDKDREKYEEFYKSFGVQLKYGVVADYGMNKDTLKDLLLFYSLNEKKLITIKEYQEKMQSEQKHIYYACGKSLELIATLPQTELVKAKGYDMLCLCDEVDEFVVNMLGEQDGKDFCSVNSDNADLLDSEKEDEIKKQQDENKELLEFIKQTLGISDVIISKKLKTHPVCLSALAGGITLEMEKYFNSLPMQNENSPKAQRVLELNSEHSVFAKLKEFYETDKEKAAVLSRVLYTQSLLIAGMPVDNPSQYTEEVCSLI